MRVDTSCGRQILRATTFMSILWACFAGAAVASDAGWVCLYDGANGIVGVILDVEATKDGGFVLVGQLDSSDRDTWVAKTDSSGTISWQRVFRGVRADLIEQVDDGGYLLGGWRWADWTATVVMRLDASGNLLWGKSFEQGKYNILGSIEVTKDGGCVLGIAVAPGCDECEWDAGVIKLGANGGVQWQRLYRFGISDYGFVIAGQTSDGGYFLACEDGADVACAKLGSSGAMLWQKTYGGNVNIYRYLSSARQTSDGGFVLAGEIYRFTPNVHDPFCLKLDRNGAVEWERVFVGARPGYATAVRQVKDGGFLIVGSEETADTTDDAWCAKLSSTGNIQWQRRVGWPNSDESAIALRALSDGGGIVAVSTSPGMGRPQSMLVRLTPSGRSCPSVMRSAAASVRVTHPKVSQGRADTVDPAIQRTTIISSAVSSALSTWRCDATW